jgi:RHH-type transcriptional regulator, proline utilization regulon repressor / proline dehydrogenase / delta 1-pyrroline-5-carboxylate dehydrogenase
MPRSGLNRVDAGLSELERLREQMRAALPSEADAVRELVGVLGASSRKLERARSTAKRWVNTARAAGHQRPLVDSMLEQFPLDSAQGRALMSLAEALLRTPDRKRADQLIAERLATMREGALPGDRSKSPARLSRGGGRRWLRFGVGALGAMGRLLPDVSKELAGAFSAAAVSKPLLAPALRSVLRRTVEKVGDAFIVGETMESALRDSAAWLCSFDVLGEGARTEADAQRYVDAYQHAIEVLRRQPPGTVHRRSGISVKLSALEPRYTLLQSERVRERLCPRVAALCRSAAAAGIGLTIDAEEADRLDLSLDVIELLARDPATREWPGLGLAVQAYGRRAPLVVDWVAELARQTGRKMSVRLVKGAYWDTEIKRAQERGLAAIPVFTSKSATDANYVLCAQRLFAAAEVLYPQFATHNALSVASVLELAPAGVEYEFQRLYGMGEALFATVRAEVRAMPAVRVYAPVGSHPDLLPYLIRRLLENGANSSFVHQFLNPMVAVEDVVPDPIKSLKASGAGGERAREIIREPARLYSPDRANSLGADWGNPAELESLRSALRASSAHPEAGGPILGGRSVRDAIVPVTSPANSDDVVGYSRDATEGEINIALEAAGRAQPAWDAVPIETRAGILERAADLLEKQRSRFIGLLVREAGRTLPDAVCEVREAADFCRYYAARGREQFGEGQTLQGPTGERNVLTLHGRGVFVCISPWNFPLAIFTGQVVAALVAGNSVVAKPAPATPLIAHAMTALLHEAGVPGDVLHLTPADGPAFGRVALVHPALAGVAFTGSTATAAAINRALAARDGAIVPLIAETGGVNAMIVDSTALTEQVVDDVVASAFTSAGQRCSALRVLYLQEEIADRVIESLVGAMKCLVVGDPAELSTDVGPVICGAAVRKLNAHVVRMEKEAKLLYVCDLPAAASKGSYFAPHLFELRAPDQLRTEEFGPILHVARYRAEQLPEILQTIRKTGFGLTLGVHSRIEGVAEHVFRTVPVGNTYVNRNMIGAVVGVQPFGGQGLSGTGPKAGGPHYLPRFATERTLTINTVALGGNLELLS